jgi:DNA-binding FrmR family transcriptional regulator
MIGNPDLVVRLRKIEGQVRALQYLAADGGDIDEFLIQLAAARGGLHAVAVTALANQSTAPGTDSAPIRRRLELISR